VDALPPAAKRCLDVLLIKYAEFNLGEITSREERICCALNPNFAWPDERVKEQAFKDLAEEVNKALPFFVNKAAHDNTCTTDEVGLPHVITTISFVYPRDSHWSNKSYC
jgi:transcriptional regulator with AAA-type ATPase domain